mgnify:CR=1 FL=1
MEFKDFIKYSNLEYKEYQNDGVNWCVNRENSSDYCKGGIIADEMGLGKTIMMIGTMLKNFKLPTLIVLPVFLLEQWREQIYKTTGHRALIYYGKLKKNITSEILSRSPIVLTTYGTVLTDAVKYRVLSNVSWVRVICDEAHHMRNRKAQIKKAVYNLKREITWLISGTPIQNHINDLYSLFDILKISNKVFTKIENLRDIMNKIILKRTKKEVGLNLPEMNVLRMNTKWSNDSERNISEDIHDKLSFSQLKQKEVSQEMRLAMLTYARMVCIYPGMISKHLEKLKGFGYIRDNSICGVNFNSKMDKVIDTIVERKNNGNKKILFTNYKEEIDYIMDKLRSNKIRAKYIDGRISKKTRGIILSAELDVLVLQIKTGNEGLNLQEYNEVYFVTPQWNPRVEEQAIARCHRMGQKKKVHVFRFVMNSFDDNMKTKNIELYSENIQEKKREIEDNIHKDNIEEEMREIDE